MQSTYCIKRNIQAVIIQDLDRKLESLAPARSAAAAPARGWLRAVREAIGMPQHKAAGRTSVTRQSYAQLEASEERGAISIESLRRAAGALDCELVYFIVPAKAGAGTYSELAAAHDPVAAQLRATEHSMSLGGHGPVGRREKGPD